MNENKLVRLDVAGAIIVGIGVIEGSKFFEEIDNGYVGVHCSVSGDIKDKALTQGVKLVGIDEVTQYLIRLQAIQSKNISVSTSDDKKTAIDIKYDYKVGSAKAAKVYKEFGNITSEDIESGWLRSKLRKVAHEVYAKYSLPDALSGDSSKVEAEVLTNFAKSVESKGFKVGDIALGIPDVDKKAQRSINAIIRVGQENEKAKLDAETVKTQAGSEAYERTKAAETEAESNRKIAESITDNLIRHEEAQVRRKYGWVTINGVDTAVTNETDR